MSEGEPELRRPRTLGQNGLSKGTAVARDCGPGSRKGPSIARVADAGVRTGRARDPGCGGCGPGLRNGTPGGASDLWMRIGQGTRVARAADAGSNGLSKGPRVARAICGRRSGRGTSVAKAADAGSERAKQGNRGCASCGPGSRKGTPVARAACGRRSGRGDPGLRELRGWVRRNRTVGGLGGSAPQNNDDDRPRERAKQASRVGQRSRDPTHPSELAYPCCLPALGRFTR